MFDIDQMFLRETTFYEAFTNKISTDFGYIFYNPDNPRSHDSNHAQILKIDENPGQVVREIKRFYVNKALVPRVYHSFVDNELEILKPYLEEEGFRIEIFHSTFFYYPAEIIPSPEEQTDIRRISSISEDIIDLIHTEDAGDWTINVLKYHVRRENFHLLCLYQAGKCIAIASVNVMEGYSRVDDVLTHKKYRGYHTGTKLIKYLVNYHHRVSDNYLYLWAVNPIAVRMYRNIGFEEFPVEKPFWMAFSDDDTSV
ncbi:MAG: GNAT family N-acetyltransferase [Dehalococcoidales bacterium]|nr:MAG: GNAT family N-acetyltransferase [Dehalococcoidales bacterium]